MYKPEFSRPRVLLQIPIYGDARTPANIEFNGYLLAVPESDLTLLEDEQLSPIPSVDTLRNLDEKMGISPEE